MIVGVFLMVALVAVGVRATQVNTDRILEILDEERKKGDE
jgi:hypothetical protein